MQQQTVWLRHYLPTVGNCTSKPFGVLEHQPLGFDLQTHLLSEATVQTFVVFFLCLVGTMGFSEQALVIVGVLLLDVLLVAIKAEFVYYNDTKSGNCSSPFDPHNYTSPYGNDCYDRKRNNGGEIVDASGNSYFSDPDSSTYVFALNCYANPPMLYLTGINFPAMPGACSANGFSSSNGPWCWTNANGPDSMTSLRFGCLTQFLTNAPTTRTPTTAGPTTSPSTRPTTSRPTSSPTTSRPTESPTSDPTVSPTFPTLSPTGAASNGICRPQGHIIKKDCTPRIKQCGNIDVKMKWTGRGCRSSSGAILGDGGCQCDGYCGYSCKNACRKDHQCYWANSICMSKATREPGAPITTCVSST